jgi:WD40 repeat protein
VFGLKSSGRQTWETIWQHQLSEYVTQVAWSPKGDFFAACSAAGEMVILPHLEHTFESLEFLESSTAPINQLSFSADGQFLAAGDQAGQVRIWSRQGQSFVPLMTHNRSGCWIEHLCWHPTQPLVAFNVGHTAEILNVATQSCVAKLDFENSSVLCLNWHPTNGQFIVGGYQNVKVWNSHHWQEDPLVVELGSVSLAIAWSADGKYLASGNMDRTITVLEWMGEQPNPKPWVMRGFPGKIRHLAWSFNSLLAAASVEGVVIWKRDLDPSVGWKGNLLEGHTNVVEAIAFRPQTKHLASAGADGLVNLWHNADRLTQTLTGSSQGFSCLSWHPQGKFLAAGGSQREVLIWSLSQAGKGFSRA